MLDLKGIIATIEHIRSVFDSIVAVSSSEQQKAHKLGHARTSSVNSRQIDYQTMINT
jgi:hypothetical protein